MFCPVSVKGPGHGVIPGRRLLDPANAGRSLPDGEVRVRALENHWVQIGSGRSMFKLAAMAKDSFPALPDVPAALAEVPAGTLGGLIDRTAFAMSSEDSRYPHLSFRAQRGICFFFSPKSRFLVATLGMTGWVKSKRPSNDSSE